MRIESKTVSPIQSGESRPSTAATPPRQQSGDVVKLSTAGTAVTAPGEADQGTLKRIAMIRTQLAAGTYPIDLDKLAGHIVDDDIQRSQR